MRHQTCELVFGQGALGDAGGPASQRAGLARGLALRSAAREGAPEADGARPLAGGRLGRLRGVGVGAAEDLVTGHSATGASTRPFEKRAEQYGSHSPSGRPFAAESRLAVVANPGACFQPSRKR